jgi:hypothetical protein
VSNWGPVKSADIILGDLTFIVGAQNTGKTYIAQLILLLSRYMEFVFDNAVITAVARYLAKSNILGTVSVEAIAENVGKNPTEVAGYLKEEAVRMKGMLEQFIISNYLVASAVDVIKQGENQARIQAEFTLAGDRILRLTFTMERTGLTNLDVDVDPNGLAVFVQRSRLQLTVFGTQGWAASRAASLAGLTKYVPTERFIVVPVFAQLTGFILSLYRSLTQPGVIPQQPGNLQLQMKQSFFDYLNDVNNALATPASYDLMRIGAIEVINRQIFFNDTLRRIKIPISSSGSGVAQLAGIVLIAERLPADFLIIEEPEVNLHADAQLQVGEYLANLSSKRKLFVTTHSQYLMAKLSIMRANGVIKDLRGYYIDPVSGESRLIDIDQKTGEVELPKTIEEALETIAKDAMALSKQLYGESG